MLIFISGQIVAANFLSLSENGNFFAEFSLKSVPFCDSDAQKKPIIERHMVIFYSKSTYSGGQRWFYVTVRYSLHIPYVNYLSHEAQYR